MKNISMEFETDLRNLAVITVTNAKDATDEEVKAVMDRIISCEAVNMKAGVPQFRSSAWSTITNIKSYDLSSQG